jgi:predicted HD phosphohydrolase
MTQLADYKIGKVRQLRDLTADDESKMDAADALLCTPEAAVGDLCKMLEMLRDDPLSQATGTISVYEHSLQSATMAYRDNASEEMVVALLFHDIFDSVAGAYHSQVAAELLRPYVSDDIYWIIRHHGVFQLYNHPTYPNELRNARDKYKGHPLFQATVDFCEKWDQAAFDPDYDTLPLEFFRPMAVRVFSKPDVNKFRPA